MKLLSPKSRPQGELWYVGYAFTCRFCYHMYELEPGDGPPFPKEFWTECPNCQAKQHFHKPQVTKRKP